MSKDIPPRKISAIWQKTNGHCWYCGESFQGEKSDHARRKWVIDHQIPVSRGGTNSIDNLVVSCSFCNGRKNDKTVEEYRRYLALMFAGANFSDNQIAWLLRHSIDVMQILRDEYEPIIFWGEYRHS